MIDFQASLIDEVFAKGEAQGHLAAERELCAELVRKYHPANPRPFSPRWGR